MSKEIYIAGKCGEDEITVDEFATELEDRGHTIPTKWWELPPLATPYLDNMNTTAPAAVLMANAAINCEVLILFPRDNILGAMAEMAFGLADKVIRKPEKAIVVVNPFEVRQSVFYGHPGVTAVRGLKAVRSLSWY